MVEVAHHPRGLRRTRGRMVGRAPPLVSASSFRRRELLSRRGALGAAFKVSGLRRCRRPAGAGILFRKLRATIESARSGKCATVGKGVELCASGKSLTDPGYTGATQLLRGDKVNLCLPSQNKDLKSFLSLSTLEA